MVHYQCETGGFYAYCPRPDCGVCGPPRGTREMAKRDDAAHAEVCSAQPARSAS